LTTPPPIKIYTLPFPSHNPHTATLSSLSRCPHG
jgi:hypothetical protein